VNALMYHDIVAAGAEDASGFPGRDAALYKVTLALLDAHLDAIIKARAAPADRRELLITFDDGGVSAMKAADALEKHGLTGHFFVTANYIGTPGFVTRSDIGELRRRGHVIGSHSCSHPLRMGHCGSAQLDDEWTRSRSTLSDILGEEIHAASVPGGDFAPRVAEAAAGAGYVRLFTSEPTPTRRFAFGLTLIGRFAIQRWTTAEVAAALAAGDGRACAPHALVWNPKNMTKRRCGERYLRLRRLLLRHGNDVRWGDRPA
jgi:peptidoglycan/xylan/chitin deacetylase (PgdA/CDA1 family)